MKSNLKGLLSRLNPYCTRALEGASGVCVNRSHYEVSIEHIFLQLLEDSQSDIPLLLAHFEIDIALWIKQLQQELEGLKNGNPGKPVFSSSLLNLFEDAWVASSVHLGQGQIRSGALLAALADNPLRYGGEFLDSIDRISMDAIGEQFDSLVEVSSEQSASSMSAESH
ncbi:MAG: type VI secretion system ATPase TssH, partial [Gammaproteobacteria bacterium]|nr:type VI secretion system ATPase TssH [Gammaproteobacteria bacterium]